MLSSKLGLRDIAMATAALCTVIPAAPVLAQQIALEEIVVTARKRDENLQDIPLSITAFTAQALDRRSIEGLSDVALLTPGLTFESYTGGGFNVPSIRGVTQQNITVLEQNVSIFLDGVYLPRAYAFDLGFDNTERVEVVKGPQAALYGQNSFMGAINYVSKRPGDAFGADFKATVGSDNLYEASGGIDIPVVEGKLSARFNGSYSEFDGTWENNHPLAGETLTGPATRNNLGGWEKTSFGALIDATPTEELSVSLSYRYFDIENEGTPRFNFMGNPLFSSPNVTILNNCGVVDPFFGPALFCGELPGPDTYDVALDPRQRGTYSETDFISANVSWAPADDFTLQYSYGYIESEALQLSSQNDANGLTPGGTLNFQATPFGNFIYSQHEVRAEYEWQEGSRILVGGFLSDLKDRDDFLLGAGIPSLSTTPVTVADLNIPVSRTLTYVDNSAIFASVSIGFLDGRGELTVEARQSWEDKEVFNVRTGVREETDFSVFAPRVSVDYDVNDNSLVYASVAKGAKSGGINPDPAEYIPFGGLLPDEKNYAPDTNWTYEIGSKNVLMDGQLALNAAAFYIDWSGMQITSISTPPAGVVFPPSVLRAPVIVLNLGDSSITGFEFDGSFQSTDNLTLLYGGSYQDAKFKDGTLGTRIIDLCDDVVCTADLGGNQLQRSSSTQLFGGFNWEAPLTSAGGMDLTYFIQGDLAWQSKQFADESNTSFIPARTILNASVGIQSDDWTVRLWAKNLADKEYVSSAFFGPFRSSFYTPIFGRKRQFGLSVSANF